MFAKLKPFLFGTLPGDATKFYDGTGGFTSIVTPPTPSQDSFLVSGGQITWTSNYNFTVSAATYYINGTLYSSSETNITLDAADADDRIDAIVVNTSSAVAIVKGTAAATPSEPDIDLFTQLKLGLVLVPTGSTEPVVSNELIYADDAGGPTEWNWTTGGSGFNVASTNNPRSGTKDIEGTTVANGAYAQGERPTGTYDPNAASLLVLYIRSKATWANGRALSISLRLSGVIVGSAVTISKSGTFGFNSATVGAYQIVAIPTSSFAITAGNLINQIRVTAVGAGHGFYLDDFVFQVDGASQQPPGGMTQDQADARYLKQDNNLSDVTSVATALANLGLSNVKTKTIGITISGAGAAITTGVKGDIRLPVACTLIAWTILADQSGAIKIDVWRTNFAGYPPVDANSITNGHEPEIPASDDNAEDTNIADWLDVTMDAGDCLRFNVDSCTTITRATLLITVTI